MRLTLGLVLSALGVMMATPALAKDPISQCTQPGQALAASAPMAATQSTMSSEDRPDGLVYPVPPKFQALLPKDAPSIDLGKVNLKTGAYTFTNQDISIGLGEFPARLHIDRTYDSSTADSVPDQIANPRFGPGAPDIKSFGIGSTHNLDIRFRSGWEAFGVAAGPVYKMIYVTVGQNSFAFQKCANGEFVSSRQDGTRLFPMGIVPNSPDGDRPGYRLELRDGTKIYLFFVAQAPEMGFCKSISDNWSATECGWGSRWEAPNGEWANLNYSSYYDKPSEPISEHLQTDNRVDSYENSQQLCILNAQLVQDCRDIDSTYSFFHDSMSGGLEARTNKAMYSYRLVSVTNSRSLTLEFTYLDPTSDAGGYCPSHNGPVGVVGSLYCIFPAKNTSQNRAQISNVKAYAGTALVKQVSYQYAGAWSNFLGSFTDPSGGETKYVLPNADEVHAVQVLKIFLPTDHQNPAVTVDMVLSNASYIQHLPVGIWQSMFAPHEYRKYPRATKQTYADGRVIEYQATLRNKWRSSSRERFGSTAPVTTWTPVEYVSKMNVVEAGGVTTAHVFDDEDSAIRIDDPLLNQTFNTYDDVGRLLTTTSPEGGVLTTTYDARGNVIQKVAQPKPGSSLPTITTSATYVGGSALRAEGCANQLTCNRPLTTTDARSAVSDYAWDAGTGLMTSATRPADSNGNRPVTSYGYTPYAAPAGGAINLLTSETVAIAPGQQVITTYGYDAANRYFPKEVVVSDGSQTLRSCMRIGQDGTPISETTPRAGLSVCP